MFYSTVSTENRLADINHEKYPNAIVLHHKIKNTFNLKTSKICGKTFNDVIRVKKLLNY